MTELELAGIESEELEYMDDEARKEVLEEDGLDPDEYDFQGECADGREYYNTI